MFLCSVRLSKKRRLLLLAGVAALIAAIVLLAVGTGGSGKEKSLLPADRAGETEAERIAFLSSFGWEVAGEAAEADEITIPESFNDVYEEYNAIQLEQGLDLKPYCGKTAKRYVYTVVNYPGEETEVSAHLLVCDGVIVGGDLASARLDGWMHGFRKP